MIPNIKELRNQLGNQIYNHKNIFIVGHNSPDFDSIGSCIGVYHIAKYYGKNASIVLDDEPSRIEPGVKRIVDENIDEYSFIRKDECLKELETKSVVDDDACFHGEAQKPLLVVCDTNKHSLISLGNDLDKFSSVFVIDHHDLGVDSIDADDMYISTDASSTSEIISRVLNGLRIPYSPSVANYLLAGISLDTKRFKQNTTSITHDVAEKLINNGADIDYVNHLFLEQFDSFCRISNLIINGTIIKKYSESLLSPLQVSFTLNRNQPDTIYLKEDYAKAADRMMKFDGIDAAFALGYVEPHVVHISARSGKRIHVGNIMSRMNGGGNAQAAGGRVITDDLFALEERLMNEISYGISDEVELKEVPQTIKVQQVKKR